MEESWEREFEVEGKTYVALFHRRPFREGLQVECKLPHTTIQLAELGYGEFALLELLKEQVELELSEKSRLG